MTHLLKRLTMSGAGSALRRFWRDERAATAIEYGLIAAGIAVAIIAAVQALGTELNTAFTKVQSGLK